MKYLKNIIIAILLWIAIVSIIQRFTCERLTETQVFKKIPETILLRFDYCK